MTRDMPMTTLGSMSELAGAILDGEQRSRFLLPFDTPLGTAPDGARASAAPRSTRAVGAGDMQQRTTLTTTNTAALVLTHPTAPTWTDALRARSILGRLGANFDVYPFSTGRPVVTGVPELFWLGENPGVDVAESEVTIDLVGAPEKTLMCTLSFSRQFGKMSNAGGDLPRTLTRLISAGASRMLDAAAINGAGTTDPLGLYGTAGVGSAPMGGALTHDAVQAMIAAAEAADADTESGFAAFVTTPEVGAAASTTPRTTGSPFMLLERRGGVAEIAGFRALLSNSVPKTLGAGAEHGIVFGADWRDVDVALLGNEMTPPGLDITVDKVTAVRRGIVKLTVAMFVDIRFPHPASFVKGTGLTAS